MTFRRISGLLVPDGLARPVSGLSLAVFRIVVGVLVAADCWRFVAYDRVGRYWVEPGMHFTYPGFGWVRPLPEPWIHYAWLLVGVSALLVTLGLFYRVSIVVLTVLFGYFFLLDQAEYLNHFYLVQLFLVLLCFLPAHRRLSLDAWLSRRGLPGTVPYASVFVLRAQMEIMLLFAGLVKLTPDWLAGEPLGLWLKGQAGRHPLGFLFEYDWAIVAGAWGTVALHLAGAPLLLFKRTRLAVVAVYAVFHLANATLFNIGIFPWLTLGATLIFFEPDWPLRLRNWLLRRLGKPVFALPPTPQAAVPLPRIARAALAAWLAVQILLPLRSLAFDSEVRWAGDGHRYSWRMRIYDRQARGDFLVIAPGGQRWVVRPTDFLTPRQASKMMVRADMIHQFAAHLAQVWHTRGYAGVAVHARVRQSLNGRPMQDFIDPRVDLAKAEISMFSADSWVAPLKTPVWGVAHNRRLGRFDGRPWRAGHADSVEQAPGVGLRRASGYGPRQDSIVNAH